MAEHDLAEQTAGNPQPRGDSAAVLEIGGMQDHDPAYDLIRAVSSGQNLRITRDGQLIATLTPAGDPAPRGDFPPALITKIAALLAEANRAVMNDRKMPLQVAEARRALCTELGVQRNDEPRSQIETRLRAALTGQEATTAPADEGPDAMVVYDVPRAGGGVAFRVGVANETGSGVLLAPLPRIVLADPAEVSAASQVFELVATEQARIHRQLYPPPEVSEAVLADALAAYAGVMGDDRYRGPDKVPQETSAMAAALAAAGLDEPRFLRTALRAYRQHTLLSGLAARTENPRATMRHALSAVLQART